MEVTTGVHTDLIVSLSRCSTSTYIAKYWHVMCALCITTCFSLYSHFLRFLKLDLEDLQLTQEDVQRMPSVKRCILEAIRLRSPGVIARGVVKAFSVQVRLMDSSFK